MILVGIPYHKEKRYALNHLLDWLEQAELPDCEVIMRWHLGTYGEKNAVKQQREFFRQLALDKNAAHLLFIDADTIPPLDLLPKLLAHNKDVVGALYNSRTQANTPLAWRDTAAPYDFIGVETLAEVDGMGAGAVLFSRNVLDKFNYGYDGDQDDWPVYRQLKAQGYSTYVDTSLICRHYQDATTYI